MRLLTFASVVFVDHFAVVPSPLDFQLQYLVCLFTILDRAWLMTHGRVAMFLQMIGGIMILVGIIMCVTVFLLPFGLILMVLGLLFVVFGRKRKVIVHVHNSPPPK